MCCVKIKCKIVFVLWFVFCVKCINLINNRIIYMKCIRLFENGEFLNGKSCVLVFFLKGFDGFFV